MMSSSRLCHSRGAHPISPLHPLKIPKTLFYSTPCLLLLRDKSFFFFSLLIYVSGHCEDNGKSNYNCAEIQKGAWWYKSCYKPNLKGLYYQRNYSGGWADVIVRETWKGLRYFVKATEMKIRGAGMTQW